MNPKAMVLYGEGLNCEEETAHAFNETGSDAEIIHINRMIENPNMLTDYQILALPGGFLHGDALGAGRYMGRQIAKDMPDEMQRFIEDGKLVIGICNGFQVLANSGFLPGLDGNYGEWGDVTVAYNDIGRFRDQWVNLKVESDKCIWTNGIESSYLPVRHGEGKFVPKDQEILAKMYDQGLVVVKYAPGDNFNGSVDDIAGICDPTGRVFGLMPHPEAYNHRTNHPRWTREDLPEEGAGLQIFRNASKYFD